MRAGHLFALLSIAAASVMMLLVVLVQIFGNPEPRRTAPHPPVSSPLRLSPARTVLVA